MDDKLVAKLKKMLALATDARGNENEAASAMAMVQATLAEYNLTIADIEAKGGETGAAAKRAKSQLEKSALYEYQRSLMAAIAEAHYCTYWTGEGMRPSQNIKGKLVKRYYHVLIGREANVTGARLMFDYLNGTIERLSSEVYPHPTNLSRSALSWKAGCADRLVDRLKERRAEADKAQADKVAAQRSATAASGGAPGTALVLLSDVRSSEDDLNADFRFGYAPGTTAANREKARGNHAAYAEKWEALQAAKAAKEEARRAALTPAQREAEDKRAAAEQARADARAGKYWERLRRESERKAASKDWGAYRAGESKAKDIGLDTQIDQKKKHQLT